MFNFNKENVYAIKKVRVNGVRTEKQTAEFPSAVCLKEQ